jgi:hypothetical protein
MKTPSQIYPHGWCARVGTGRIGLGLDLGTTEQKTSNPSSLTVMEEVQGTYPTRLVLTWKTADERVTRELIRLTFVALSKAGHLGQLHGMGIDASNEGIFAKQLQREFRRFCPVHLIKGGQKLAYKGEEHPAKVLLGNLYANAFTSGIMRLPAADWLREDHRLVTRAAGSFTTKVSPDGRHGDTFDSGKLAFWMLAKPGGVVDVGAAAVGNHRGTNRKVTAEDDPWQIVDAAGNRIAGAEEFRERRGGVMA